MSFTEAIEALSGQKVNLCFQGSREISRKVLEAPSPGRLSQGDFAGDAPEDGG